MFSHKVDLRSPGCFPSARYPIISTIVFSSYFKNLGTFFRPWFHKSIVDHHLEFACLVQRDTLLKSHASYFSSALFVTARTVIANIASVRSTLFLQYVLNMTFRMCYVSCKSMSFVLCMIYCTKVFACVSKNWLHTLSRSVRYINQIQTPHMPQVRYLTIIMFI